MLISKEGNEPWLVPKPTCTKEGERINQVWSMRACVWIFSTQKFYPEGGDVEVNSNFKDFADWQDPNGDELILGVIGQVCRVEN